MPAPASGSRQANPAFAKVRVTQTLPQAAALVKVLSVDIFLYLDIHLLHSYNILAHS